jgi:hypothetical protein
MNRMNTPGFTAEASLYKTSNFYGMAATFEALEASGNLYLQRVSGPYGPIGLPGQNCEGACLHVCMLTGRATKECMDNCMSTCTGSPFTVGLRMV